MGLRLVRKSITLAVRSRRRFIVFTVMYTTLMMLMCFFMQSYIDDSSATQIPYLLVTVFATIILSIMYAWIIINYRKQEIATLKCIGYTNPDIRTLIIGEPIFVTIIAFIVVVEFLIHYTAGATYFFYQEANFVDAASYVASTRPLFGIWTVVIVLAMFLASQIIGILVMYQKILKLRPIVALRVLK